MAAPLLGFTGCCCGKIPETNDIQLKRGAPKQLGNHCYIIAPIVDALISLTCLVVGILGATSVIVMPAAAAYTMIGVSCLITLAWIAMVIACCVAPD